MSLYNSSRTKRHVLYLHVITITIFYYATIALVSPTLLPAVNELSYFSTTCITSYASASVVGTIPPNIGCRMITHITFIDGQGLARTWSAVLAVFEVIIVILSCRIVLLFYLGYALYSK